MPPGPIVVVVGRQRSGTTVVRKAIESTECYKDLNEIFHSDFLANPADYKFFAFLYNKILSDPHYILPPRWESVFDEFVDLCVSDHAKGIIFDLKYNALNFVNPPPLLASDIGNYYVLDALARREAIFFHVIRNNVLKAIVSERVASSTGQWGLRPGEARLSATVRLDPNTLVSDLTRELETRRLVERALGRIKNVHVFRYAELFASNEAFSDDNEAFSDDFITRVQSLIPHGFVNRTPYFLRQADRKLCEVVDNFDEVGFVLEKTDFEWMLSGEEQAPVYHGADKTQA
jgi:hypothetical protein